MREQIKPNQCQQGQAPREVVLIVEDHPVIRSHLQQLFNEIGCETRAVRCAADALPVIETENPMSVLLTDVDTPGLISGISLAWRVASTRPEVCIIVSSGRYLGARQIPRGALFLQKPYRPAHLLSLLVEALERQRSH